MDLAYTARLFDWVFVEIGHGVFFMTSHVVVWPSFEESEILPFKWLDLHTTIKLPVHIRKPHIKLHQRFHDLVVEAPLPRKNQYILRGGSTMQFYVRTNTVSTCCWKTP